MAKASPIQNSFNAGELSPQLKGRPDIEKYKSGCEILENFIPQVHGPARKRTGTRYVNEVKNSGKYTRLVPFEYSSGQAYIIEFGEYYLRFYTYDSVSGEFGLVLLGGSPYEVLTSYKEDELSLLDFAQSADVIYITHPDRPTRKLSRLTSTSWSITDAVFDWPAFLDENVGTTTITASATTGTVTLTASSNTFENGNLYSHYKFSEIIQSKYDEWLTNKSISTGAYRYYDGNLYKATSTGTTGTRAPVHLEGTESDGAVNWEYQHSGSGYVKITAIASATSATGTVIKQLPVSVTSGTKQWAEGAWSTRRGFPRAVTFYEDRLWFGGTSYKPQTVWASVSGDYENFQYGTNDDDALSYTINTQDVNTVQWLVPGKILAVGTSAGEFTISASSLNEAITPTNVKITPQTTFGNATGVRPYRVGGVTLFVQRAGRKLREYVYDYQTDSFVAPNMTVLAEHISETGFVDMTYQQEPDQILWLARADGKLVGLTYERQENVVGWHQHDLGGTVESIVTIPHWDGDQDVTFMIVKRTINSSTVRYIEYLEKYTTDDFAHFVDCGLTYSGSAATVITGLDHLEGETVTILADGNVHPVKTVTSGQITLDYAASTVVVGLGFISTLKTMPLEAGSQNGVAQGKTMRINDIVMRVHQTGPGLWYGPDTSTMDEYHTRMPEDPMDEPTPLFTGDTPILAWPGDYQNIVQMTVQHRLPLPCTLVALMPQVHTYDR